MHILQARLPAEQASGLGPPAKRLSFSDWANAPTYDKSSDLEKRQDPAASVTTITGSDFTVTFTFNQPITLTLGQNTATTVPPASPTSSTPAAPTTTTTSVPIDDDDPTTALLSPIASAVNTKSAVSTNSAAENNTPLGATAARTGAAALPTGAIVGIALVIVVLILGVFVFLVRQRAVRQRKLKRATAAWATGAAGFAQPQPQEPGSFSRAYPATPGGAAEMGMGMGEQSPGVSFARAQAAALASRPPPPPPSAYTGAPASAALASLGTSGTILPSGTTATVKYEFIPNLPDELSIVAGDIIRIVAEYDDGWALCANRGEQGMVPLECLDRNDGPATTYLAAPAAGGARNSRRGSSLGARY